MIVSYVDGRKLHLTSRMELSEMPCLASLRVASGALYATETGHIDAAIRTTRSECFICNTRLSPICRERLWRPASGGWNNPAEIQCNVR